MGEPSVGLLNEAILQEEARGGDVRTEGARAAAVSQENMRASCFFHTGRLREGGNVVLAHFN